MKILIKFLVVILILALPLAALGDTKISSLTPKTNPVPNDTTIIVDSVGGANKKITLGTIPLNPANEASDTTCFLIFVTDATGTTLTPKTNTGLTYNAATNALAATTFSGALSGTASKATNLVGGNGTTLLGSIPYQSGTDTTTLLPPNTTTTQMFLTQTGDGTNGAVPQWTTVPAYPLGWGNIDVVGGAGAPAHKTTPVGGDYIYLGNSASSNANSYATLTELSAQITAAKATILATARAINGVNFDGSAPITVPSKPVVGTITDGVNDGGTYKVYPSTDGTATGTKVTHFTVTAAAHDITIEIPVGSWTDGEEIIIRIKGTGARALTWITTAGGFRAGDTNPGALPTSTVTTLTLYCKFIYNSASSTFDYCDRANNF